MTPKPNQQLAVREPPKAINIMAERLRIDPGKLMTTLKATVFRGASDEELMALCVVANEFGLNPLLKQIHAFKPKNKEGVEVGSIQPVVSIDGWVKIINDHPDFDGVEWEEEDDKEGKPISKTCVLYRKGCSRPTKIKERYKECYRNTAQWNTMPHRMLRHKSYIQCGRVAFGLGGIYDEDEARDIIRNVEGRVVEDAEPKRPIFKRQPAELPEAESKPEPAALVLEGQTEEQLAAEDIPWEPADQDGNVKEETP